MPAPRVPRDVATAASREAIMDVAERLMARKGYAATTVAAICDASGLPVGSVYHHFGSKVGLLWAILARGRGRFGAQLPPLSAYGGSPRERLAGFYRGAASTIVDNLAYVRIILILRMQPGNDPELQSEMAEWRARVIDGMADVLTEVAAEAGARDPAVVGRRLGNLSTILVDGTVCRLNPEAAELQDALAEIAELLWYAIIDQAASDGTPVGSLS